MPGDELGRIGFREHVGGGHGIAEPTGAAPRAPVMVPSPGGDAAASFRAIGEGPYHAAMAKYASALSQHPVAAHAVGEAAGEILEAFDGEDPDLVVCFVSPHFVGAIDDFAFALGNLLDPSVLIGATAVAIIGGAHEVEEGPAVSLFAACMPDAQLTPVSLSLEDTPDGQAITGWPELDHEPGTWSCSPIRTASPPTGSCGSSTSFGPASR